MNSSDKPYLILIVDDIETNLKLLGLVLQEHNYDVSIASSGKEALTILETEIPDLILLDIMMPEMDGFEVCRRIKSRNRTKEIPVIFLTAKTETEDIVRGFELGAVDYITKPFKSYELLARVSTHLQLKQASEDLKYSNLTKSRFFSIITNDIKDSLVGVKGLTNFLIQDMRTAVTEDSLKLAEIVYSDSSKLYSMLESIVEWSIIQTDKMELKPENVNIYQSVENVIMNFKGLSDIKNVKLVNLIDKDLTYIIDSKLINIVFSKLISNGIKYSYSGGEVKIYKTMNNENQSLEISVEDNGRGMDNEELEHLFKIEYSDTKKKGTANEPGSGLGLLICKDVLSKIDSKIWIESKKEKGTIVTFSLPLISE